MKKTVDPRETKQHKNDYKTNRRFARGEKPLPQPKKNEVVADKARQVLSE
jgi:hypothetical protein